MRPWSVVLAISLLPTPAAAQALLTLRAGFTPDPQTVAIRAGGNVEVDEGSCTYGYVAESGGMAIDYTAGSLPLHIYAESDIDTMLFIMLPSGEFLCDDDSHGSLNPRVSITDPESGRYIILVGGYTQDEYRDATVYVTELTPDGANATTSSSGSTIPDLSRDPYFGRLTIDVGFSPDPHTVAISAGGSVDLDVSSCTYGWVGSAPDFNLTYNGSSGSLYMFARSEEDIMLLVNQPDGSWICDDDSLGDADPVVTIPNARSGVYNIWVGTYSERDAGDLVDATLYLSTKGAK